MKTLVICGSNRFLTEIREISQSLKNKGVVVYEPYLHPPENEWEKLSEDYKKYISLGLTHDHIYNIRLADVVFIYNKNKYVGVGTTMEIGCAIALGKPVYALEADDEEWARRALYRGTTTNVEELLEILK